MSVRSAQAITVEFSTSNPTTGAAVNADSLPAGTLVLNGTDNAASVTVTNVATGRYKCAVTLPTLAIGDIVEMSIAATVSTIPGVAIVYRDTCDLNLTNAGRVDLGNVLGTAPTATTAGVLDVNTKNINNATAATPGASGGLLISGSNAGTTTLAALTISGNTTFTGTMSGTFPTVTTTGTATAVTTVNGFANAALLSLGIITAGTAQAGGSNTITLAAGEANVNNAFSLMGASIVLTSGTSSGQSSFITGYVGSTKVATVSPAWQIGVPGSGTKYVILPGPSQFTGAMLTQLNAATPSVNVENIGGNPAVSTNGKLWVLDDNGNSVANQATVATINGQTSQIKFNGVGLVESAPVFDQTSPAVAATGSVGLSAVPGPDAIASVQIGDGTTSVVFAFTSNGPQGVSVATIPGDIAGTLVNLGTAIQANLAITAAAHDTAPLTLTDNTAGAAGNVDIVLTDNTAIMSATGMSGGLDAVVTYDAIAAQPATPTNITAASGVTLAASQPDYAPAKASDILVTPGQPIATDSSGRVTTSGGSSLHSGTAQGGSPNTITLDSGASTNAGSYVGAVVTLTGGTGANQQASITAYNTSTKVAMVNGLNAGNWFVAPDNTTTFTIQAAGTPTVIRNVIVRSVTVVSD